MAESTSRDGVGLSMILNVLLIGLTVAGGLVLVGRELTSARPPTLPRTIRGGVGNQTIDARLWEDPLRPYPQSWPGRPRAIALEALGTQIEHERKRPGPSCPEDSKSRANDTIPGNCDRPPSEAEKDGKDSRLSVLLMPVMISGGPYVEDQESRIRSRFAVVSALVKSGYAPVDEEHIGEVVLPWESAQQMDDEVNGGESNPPCSIGRYCDEDRGPCCAATGDKLTLRYEWYRQRTFHPGVGNGKDLVLLLWLDEGFFDNRPMERLRKLLGPLVRKVSENETDTEPNVEPDQTSSCRSKVGRRTPVHLIGPRESTTLRAMLPGQFEKPNGPLVTEETCGFLQNVELFSAGATAMDEVLVESGCSRTRRRDCVARVLRDDFHFAGAHFFSADDATIAQEVVDELQLRGVDAGNTADHIVLLTESDTFFGRSLSLAYGAALSVRQDPSTSWAEFVDGRRSGKAFPKNLFSFSYLRGLDGKTTCDGRGADCESAPRGDRKRERPTSLEDIVDRPGEANKAEGPGQFDYLTRIGDQIAERQDELSRARKGRIKAIGIVGSDVYDVLLILQALRPRFPDILFFTSELDARFLHPSERDWSRNLIVASSYGLRLDPGWQDVPPFRDSHRCHSTWRRWPLWIRRRSTL